MKQIVDEKIQSHIIIDSNKLFILCEHVIKSISEEMKSELDLFVENKYIKRSKSLANKFFPKSLESLKKDYESYSVNNYLSAPADIINYFFIKNHFMKKILKAKELQSLAKFQETVLLTSNDCFFLQTWSKDNFKSISYRGF